jgi:thiamine pyrophosphate-dependent acetolactate synthase large subunit-like protein
MNLSDALTVTLRDWDLKYVFGVSGANVEHFHDSIHRLGQGRLVSVMAKSEIGAAFMADCRARVRRTLGVCCATSGGGMMNLAVGIAESYADGVPVLAIVGQPPTTLEGRGAFQDSSGRAKTLRATQLWESLSKYCAKITRPADFWPTLTAAVQQALSGRPGPSVLLIPRDLYDAEVGPRPDELSQSLFDLISNTAVSRDEVTQLYQRLRLAEAPVLLLGHGVERSRFAGHIVKFARQAGIPVATSLAAKASFPNDDALYLGLVGVAGEPSVHRYLANDCDLLVAVGTTLDVMTRHPIQAAIQPDRLIAVAVDAHDAAWPVKPSLVVEGDPGLVFKDLQQLAVQSQLAPRAVVPIPVQRFVTRLAPPVSPQPSLPCSVGSPQAARSNGNGAASTTVAAKVLNGEASAVPEPHRSAGFRKPTFSAGQLMAGQFMAGMAATANSSQERLSETATGVSELGRPRTSASPQTAAAEQHIELLQSTAIDIIQSFLPTVGHILFDAGNCAAAGLHSLRIPAGVSSTIALGMGGMGYAIAGAIGAQLGATRPARTLVLCGDGAFLMQGLEIHTAIQYQLPILFLVFNNSMHGMCVTRQQLYFEGRVECAQYPRFSAAGVAAALGDNQSLWTRSAKSPFELTDALHEYHHHFAEGPGVLELILQHEEIPPFTPFLPADAPTFFVDDPRPRCQPERATRLVADGRGESAGEPLFGLPHS